MGRAIVSCSPMARCGRCAENALGGALNQQQSPWQRQLNLDGVLDGQHVRFGQHAQPVFEACLVSGHDLICHRLAALPADGHHALAGDMADASR